MRRRPTGQGNAGRNVGATGSAELAVDGQRAGTTRGSVVRRSPTGRGGVATESSNGGHVGGRAVRRPTGVLPSTSAVTGTAVPRPPASTPSGYRGNGGYAGYGGGRNYGGHRYSYNYRYGYGYHGPRYGYGYGYRHKHVYFPGYSYPRVYGSYFYFPGFSFGVGFGHGPLYAHVGYSGYGPYHYGFPYYGSAYYGTGVYAYNAADAYTGFLRLKVRPRYAQVYADGYFVGIVNDFDGIFQRLRLEEGPHTIEIRHPGYESMQLDVLIVPGEKVTFEGDMLPQP